MDNLIKGSNFMKNIQKRKSVRTYSSEEITVEIKKKLKQYITKLEESYDGKFRFPIIDPEDFSNNKIGTYGVIKGARYFICGIVKKDSMDLIELGYAFEKIIIFATSLGIGTCWLGGTFERSNFAKSANLKEDEIFIVTTPIGYEKSERSLTEITMRKLAKSDSRKNWKELFFDGTNVKALEKNDLGIFGDALEMVRIGPSASNKQPWRIVKNEDRMYSVVILLEIDENKEEQNIWTYLIGTTRIYQMAKPTLEDVINSHFLVVNYGETIG